MTKIAPFPGIRYNPSKVEDPAAVIAPPYDKISTDMRKQLNARDPYNVCKLILPPPSDQDIDVMTSSMDGEGENWYADAAARLQKWMQDGILVKDEPQLYVYKQTYSYGGVKRERSGLFVALELDDEGGPHAHENTFEGPKADRLRLLRANQTNTSPIFLLSDGEWDGWQQVFAKAKDVLLDFTDDEGQHHELLALSDDTGLKAAMEYIHERTLVIADGHHRYETAKNYRQEMLEKTGATTSKDKAWGFCFALVVPIKNPGLIVLPTHRVIKSLPENWMNTLKTQAEEHCDVKVIPNPNADLIRNTLNDAKGPSVIAYSKKLTILLTVKNPDKTPGLDALPEPTRPLNVSVLHHYALGSVLGQSGDDLQGKVRYVRGEENAIAMVDSGEYDGVFLLKGIEPEKVFEVSLQGVRMPQKSTDFYPKIPTGLVMRPAAD